MKKAKKVIVYQGSAEKFRIRAVDAEGNSAVFEKDSEGKDTPVLGKLYDRQSDAVLAAAALATELGGVEVEVRETIAEVAASEAAATPI